MSTKSIEERLEDYCEFAEATKRFSDAGFCRECIAEIERLRQLVPEEDDTRLTEDTMVAMGDQLTQIVNVTKGQPDECSMHSTHDAVESVQEMADRLKFVESCLANLSSHIREAMVISGLRRDGAEDLDPPLTLLNELAVSCKNAGTGNFDQQYFELLKVLDEVGQPWMREDGEGGMKAVLRKMADAASLNGTPSGLDNVKHLARFLAKHWSDLDDLRGKFRAMSGAEIKEAAVFRWPIIQGSENQKCLKAISEQEIKGDKVSAGVKVLLKEHVGDSSVVSRQQVLQPDTLAYLDKVIETVLQTCQPRAGAAAQFSGEKALEDLSVIRGLLRAGKERR
jgi:hypothetical protein